MDFVSNEEIVMAAHKNLEQGAWDYLVGGSESETTLRRNRLAYDKLGFRPRVLRDVSKIDTSTEFLGQKLRMPVMLAPIGSLQAFTPDGRRCGGAGRGRVRRHARRQHRDAADAGGDCRGFRRGRRSSSSTCAATTSGSWTSWAAPPSPVTWRRR